MLSAREKGAVACRLRDLRATWHIRHCERKRSNPEISPRKQPGLLPPTREGASADSKRAIARAASDGGSSLALLAMTGRAALRSRGMICPRFALAVIPRRERAQGKPGAQQAPAASHANKKAHERSRHRFAETIRPSLRNGLRLIPRSPRRPGFLATVARELLHELDASVGASGPHGFAVRDWHVRLTRQHVHRIPTQRS